MFEQSVIPRNPKGKRVWTTFVGVGGHALLVTGMVIAPMLWPQVMPPASYMLVVPHAPPGRPKGNPEAKPQTHATARPVRKYIGLIQPAEVPKTIALVTDPLEPVSSNIGSGCPGCIPGGIVGGDPNGVQGSPLIALPNEPTIERPQPKVEQPKAVVEQPMRRVKVGGIVEPPQLIYRVNPPYPPLAKAAHVEGTVKLNGVISIDGRIIQLSVESGNPLLVPAARAAVLQWRYTPTRLNGDPVEVETTIVVTFTLSR